MATITMSLTVGSQTFTRSKSLSDADAGRLANWAKDQYDASTNNQAFAAMVEGVFAGLRENVLSYERAQAAQTAQSNVADVVMS